VITAAGNFHGRTISIVTFSTEETYRAPFGPFTPGFSTIPYGDLEALEKAITADTVAFLVEPIQGEGGIIVPPAGYLKKVVDICRKHNVLAVFDEVQTGLARTGRMFAFEHEDARPDLLILGKALGGGILPVSATVGTRAVMEVLRPGEHGSTFGGMPLSMAVGIEALDILVQDKLSERAARLGEMAMGRLRDAKLPGVREVRGKGLLIGIEFEDSMGGAHAVGEALMKRGVLAKDTRVDTLRLAPSLTIEEKDLNDGLAAVEEATREVAAHRKN
jgi:ornithine--oxo-acid transaminase